MTMNMASLSSRRNATVLLSIGFTLLAAVFAERSIQGQTFDTGSDGSDGALTLAANQGVIVFDPKDQARWGRVLDQDGDGVYNFTTVSVGAGTTLKFTSPIVSKPIHFLASGTITVSGALDLSGAAGISNGDPSTRRIPNNPGSGGFSGGISSPTSGEGPLGGVTGLICQNAPAGSKCGDGGGFSGNRYLIPLIGGSGGGGADYASVSGGAGGGALLLASSVSIAVTGTIVARGGDTPVVSGNFNSGIRVSGGGAGGAIRLVAPVLSGGGALDVSGGVGFRAGSSGLVRLESNSGGSEGFQLPAGGQSATRGSIVNALSLRPVGSVRVVAVGGVAVAPNPSGSFVLPDVTINSGTAVPVDIEATGIPPGTVVTLRVFPQTPTDLAVVSLPAVHATLSGTLENSSASVNFVFPYGFSRGTVRATW